MSSKTILNRTSRLFLSTETRQAIKSAVSSAPVVLFMKGTPDAPKCGFSRATVALLGYEGLNPSKFKAFNILDDVELRDGIKEYTDWPTIPQLFVNGEFIGGCDVIVSMSKNGDLNSVFEEADVLLPEEERE